MSRDLNDLIPEMIPLVEEGIRQCQAREIPIVITSTARNYREQFALFAQGREPLKNVNKYRSLCGLWPLKIEKENVIVTWTLNSKHLVNLDDGRTDNDKSRAFDFVLLNGGKMTWDIKTNVNKNQIPDYLEAGIIESLGLEWGGRWPKPDCPHVQLK